MLIVFVQGLPWIFPCLGSGLYGFSMSALIPIALTYLTDSYNKVSSPIRDIRFNTWVYYFAATDVK
jgi:hypothetical protein